jgi:hypothetical protein
VFRKTYWSATTNEKSCLGNIEKIVWTWFKILFSLKIPLRLITKLVSKVFNLFFMVISDKHFFYWNYRPHLFQVALSCWSLQRLYDNHRNHLFLGCLIVLVHYKDLMVIIELICSRLSYCSSALKDLMTIIDLNCCRLSYCPCALQRLDDNHRPQLV